MCLTETCFSAFPLIADWHAITQRREYLIHENLMREHQKRRGYDYAPRQLVLKKKWKPKKLGKRTSGPYKIVQVHVNGTVTNQLRPGLTETINIRQIIIQAMIINQKLIPPISPAM